MINNQTGSLLGMVQCLARSGVEGGSNGVEVSVVEVSVTALAQVGRLRRQDPPAQDSLE
jgi:hypothetical protein